MAGGFLEEQPVTFTTLARSIVSPGDSWDFAVLGRFVLYQISPGSLLLQDKQGYPISMRACHSSILADRTPRDVTALKMYDDSRDIIIDCVLRREMRIPVL